MEIIVEQFKKKDMLLIKKLIDSGFDIEKLPNELKQIIFYINDFTNGTFITDNQKISVLDEQIFNSINSLYPNETTVISVSKQIDSELKQINNDGFNTIDEDEPTDFKKQGGLIYHNKESKNTPTMQDLIPGGLSKGMTLSDIAKKHSVSLSELKKEFEKGIKTEMEHTTSKNIASEIATDHLFEDPKYYTKLSEMENKNALCPVGTEIQSIIFERKKMSLTEARKWVKKHKYSDAKLDKTDNYYRFRQQMPSKFEKGSIRTITLTDGIKGIIGCPLNKMAKGGSVEDYTAQILKIVSKYGWSVQKNLNRYQVYNKKGVNNFDIIIKGDKYTFEDSAGTKLMSGSGQLEKSIDKLATEYFYAKAEEPQTEKEAAIKQASEIVEIAMNNGISVQKLSFNEYSDAIFKATNTSYGLPYLSLAYDVQTNIEAKNNDLIVYTSAPENYDGFGTKTIELTDYFDTRGKQVRKVNIPIKNKDWQTNRYASGNFGFYNEKDFNELVTLSGSPFKKQTLGQASKGVIMEYLDWEENLYSILEELGDMSRGDAQGLVEAAEMNGLNLREKYSLGISEKEIAESILGENNIPQNIIDAAEIINAVGPSASDAGTEDRKLYSEALKTIKESEYKMEMGELKKKDKFSLKTEYANPYELNRAIESFLDNNGIENLTSEQKAFIKRYSGYGGLEKYGATGSGLLYEYYTPDAVIQKMWGLAFDFGFVAGKSILEPSCGTGEFIKYAPSQSPVIGYEINKYSALIAKALYPNAVIKLENFEKIFIKNNSSIKDKVSGLTKYDLIIGNPPYGDFTGKYAGMGEKDYTKATNYIEYFILRGLDLLNEGGLLVFIVGAEKRNGGRLFLESGATEAKKKIAEKSELLKAYRLPAGVFDRTGVVSEIVVIKKI